MKLRQVLLFIIILLTSCFLSFSLFAQAPTAGLLCHFKFGNDMINSGPASITAAGTGTSFTTDKFGNANSALQLAGNTNSYVTFTDNGNLDFTGNFTASFLFYFTGTANSGMLDNCLNYNGWGVWCWNVNGPWNIQFNFRNGSVGSTLTQFNANTWYHVTAVRNSGTISVYLNGALKQSATEGTQTPSYPIAPIAGAMAFAAMTPPRYNPYAGKMDEIRIYNRALTTTEIAQLASFTLPLQMGEFTAVKQSAGIKLNWHTFSEQNTSHFDIERSIDGNNYTVIGNVNAAGNSTSTQYYSYTDLQAPAKTVFYRLRMVDLDGTYRYSQVVAIKNNTNLIAMTLFPSPATDVIQLQIPSERKEMAKLMIVDAAGKQVHTQSLQLNEGTNAVSIPVSHLPAGTYYLITETESGKQSGSFIKN